MTATPHALAHALAHARPNASRATSVYAKGREGKGRDLKGSDLNFLVVASSVNRPVGDVRESRDGLTIAGDLDG